MYAIVEARHVHGLRHTTFQRSLSSVHALGYRARRVELVAEVLQSDGNLAAFLAALLRNLVAYRPHHDAGMVAVGQYEIGDVFVGPLTEEAGVAILALRINPHIE